MMIHTIGERACQQAGEVYETVQVLMQGTPTAEQWAELLEAAKHAEQLSDATARGIALVVAGLRLGPEAQRTRRLASEWRDVERLEAVVQVAKQDNRVVRLKRKIVRRAETGG